jgi:nitrous oxidase accessory protein
VKQSASLLALLLLLSAVFIPLPLIGTVKAGPKTVVVPDDCSTIQEAIDNADEGDTIFVKKGTYEGPINETLLIDKTISLIGEETTILNLHPLLLNKTLFYQPYLTYNTSLIVEANNVTISGFTVKIPPSPAGGGGGASVIGNGTRINNCIINIPSLSLGGSYLTISETFLLGTDIIIRGSNQTIYQTKIFKGDLEINSSHNQIIENTMMNDENEIRLTGSYNIISGNSFSRIFLECSDSNTIHNNTCSLIWLGLYGHTCSNNIISGNILDGGYIWGILMGDGSYNVFYDNYITDYGGSHDGYGVAIGGNHQVAENNTFYHNTFENNNKNVGYNWQINGIGNSWDNGIEGNYWDDYNGTDADGDGIGDTPYIIDEKNQDDFPLMAPTSSFSAGTWEYTDYWVDISSNSTLSDFNFNHEIALIRFNVEGEDGTTGFCRVMLPKDLLFAEDNWTVLIENNLVTPTVNEDKSNTYLYFTYPHSTKTIEIKGMYTIPEFPSWIILQSFLVATLFGIFVRKKSTSL